jgi:hypothetical protein
LSAQESCNTSEVIQRLVLTASRAAAARAETSMEADDIAAAAAQEKSLVDFLICDALLEEWLQ